MAEVVNDQSEHKEPEHVPSLAVNESAASVEIDYRDAIESPLSSASSSGSTKILKTGMLYKKGGITGSLYNPRYFELLDNGELAYYIVGENGAREKKGGIMLSSTTKIEKRSGGTRRDAKFIIHHPEEGKKWFLWCYSPQNESLSLLPAIDSNSSVHSILHSDSEADRLLQNAANGKKAANEWVRVLKQVVLDRITAECVGSDTSSEDPALQQSTTEHIRDRSVTVNMKETRYISLPDKVEMKRLQRRVYTIFF